MPKSPAIKFEIDEEAEQASVSVDGKTYSFSYGFEAIHTFFLARKFNPHFQPMGPDPINWASLLWVGLLDGAPELKFESVVSWFTASTAEVLYEGTWKAFTLGRPKPSQEAQASEKSENPPSA